MSITDLSKFDNILEHELQEVIDDLDCWSLGLIMLVDAMDDGAHRDCATRLHDLLYSDVIKRIRQAQPSFRGRPHEA